MGGGWRAQSTYILFIPLESQACTAKFSVLHWPDLLDQLTSLARQWQMTTFNLALSCRLYAMRKTEDNGPVSL